jgi:outer membrane protein OmpA-like peptidoglycan-associated protein
LVNIPSGITFPVDSAAIQPNFQQTLSDVAQTLNRYESSYIDVYGHTDASGSDAYNQGLSERRAASVSAFLQRQGVNGARLATKGYGETQPIASNETIDGRAQNRRVELRIVPVTQDDLG